MNDIKHDKAGIIAPPPVIYLGILIVGLLIDWRLPLGLIPNHIRLLLGWPLIVGGGLLLFLAVRAMRRARTAVDPYKPTTAIVVDGPYRSSRNPMYIADALIYLGIATLINTFWPMLLFPIALLIMQKGVIAREEQYLEQKFGDQYLQYKARVRRWL